MRPALLLVACLAVSPAFADDDPYRAPPPSPDERVWRTPYTLDIPADLTPRSRERDINLMTDPQQQADPSQQNPTQPQPRPVFRYRTGRGR